MQDGMVIHIAAKINRQTGSAFFWELGFSHILSPAPAVVRHCQGGGELRTSSAQPTATVWLLSVLDVASPKWDVL